MWKDVAIELFGGMGLLLYGMYVMSEGLQKICGQKLRTVLSELTKNRIMGTLVGAVITIIFQSSTATTVILVGLTSASIISLRQTLSVTLGSGIGTTVTAQLIALKITEISLPIVGIGALIIFFCRREKYRRIGQALIGFGLVFLGLKIMGDVMNPISQDPYFTNLLTKMGNQPFLAILISTVFTFLVHSSAATIGIIMALAGQGLVEVNSAIYLIFGANIGTTFTAIISSLGSSRESKRVAVAHFIFKTLGTILFIPFIDPFSHLVVALTPFSPSFQIANIHTAFNVVSAIIFLPFISNFASLLEYIIPEKQSDEAEIIPRYLDENLVSSPDIGIGMASMEVIRISDRLNQMISKCGSLFHHYNVEEAEIILQKEDQIDILSEAINKYLTQILRQQVTKDEFNKCMGMVNIVKEYEHMGDVMEKNIIYLAESKYANNIDFSAEGHKEHEVMLQKINEMLQTVSTAFVTHSCNLAEKAKLLYEEIVDLEFRFRISHFTRMQHGAKESENTSSIYLDLLESYKRMAEHMNNIALSLTDEISCTWQDELEILYGETNHSGPKNYTD